MFLRAPVGLRQKLTIHICLVLPSLTFVFADLKGLCICLWFYLSTVGGH